MDNLLRSCGLVALSWLQCNSVQEVSQCTERPPTLFPTCFVAKMVTKHGMGLNKQSRSVVDVIVCLQYFINADHCFGHVRRINSVCPQTSSQEVCFSSP